MACMLWEDTFYENGVDVSKRIQELIPNIAPEKVAEIAIEAREKMHLRHAPLFIVREMARLPGFRPVVAKTLERVIQRADELAEFLAIYWKDGRCKIASSVKKGLAAAFPKFSAYNLAKYNRDGAVKLRDVLFLCHARPKDEEQAKVWKQLVEGTLAPPDTWEVELSAGKGEGKKASWERLLGENKLGPLALLRNLRNMHEVGVDVPLVREALGKMKPERVLPFRFIAAARANPTLEPELEAGMFKSLEAHQRLPGKTAIVVDNSGSMSGAKVSARSDMDRSDAACALAVLIREICEDVVVIGFGNTAKVMPSRRGFALVDAIKSGPGGGTNTDNALALVPKDVNRVVVITDEQSHQEVRQPGPMIKGYFINVGTYKNGIGYGRWTHIDGWSEQVVNYMLAAEAKGRE